MEPLHVAFDVVQELVLLVRAPSLAPEMLWVVVPMVITVLLVTLYFGKYMQERIGWDSALGNSLVLLFVCIDILRTLHRTSGVTSIEQLLHLPATYLILLVLGEGLLLSFTAFYHELPERLEFLLASPASIYTQLYVLLAIVYIGLTPSWITLCAALVLFIVIMSLLRLLQGVERLLAYRIRLPMP